jgi:hypothetical protein
VFGAVIGSGSVHSEGMDIVLLIGPVLVKIGAKKAGEVGVATWKTS